MPAPIPRPAPVTIATLPSSLTRSRIIARLRRVELLRPAPELGDGAVAVAQDRPREIRLALPDRDVLVHLLHDVADDRRGDAALRRGAVLLRLEKVEAHVG